MIFLIENKIRVLVPTDELIRWCKKILEVPNPEYAKKKRMGLWTGGTASTIVLWEKVGDEVHIPYGCLEELMKLFPDGTDNLWLDSTKRDDYMNLLPGIPLYDYQIKATTEMLLHHNGILQAPAGSGKTQMGLSLIATLGKRALWLTHTKDLLNQSKERAEQYWPSEVMGTITEGKVNIGTHVTFATVQTLSHVDLSQYQDYWDLIIVDEVHRVAGSPTAVTMFSKVLNSLRAQFKYGLSATVHRADGLIRCTYALVGPVQAIVPKSDVKKTVMDVTVYPRSTGIVLSRECLQPDGTINWQKMVSYLTNRQERNLGIIEDIVNEVEDGHSCLVLSDRISHLKKLESNLPLVWMDKAAVIDGKSKKQYREESIEYMRTGENRILFATYSLCKEGLDIPRLDRLFLTTPQKDYAVITQSIGRIARVFDGKEDAVCYDYVDNIQSLKKKYKQRCTTYRKQGCVILEEP